MHGVFYLRRSTWVFNLAIALAVFGLSNVSQAHFFFYSVNLIGANASPVNLSPGVGSGFVSFDLDLETMDVDLTFSGLQGNVLQGNPPFAAALYVPTTTGDIGTAIVAIPFTNFPSGTSGTYTQTFDLTVAPTYDAGYIAAHTDLSNAFNFLGIAAENGDPMYLQIRTSAFPNGEIRGFLVAIPEPSSLLLTGLALAGYVSRYRRNRLAR